ncbi:hypothetical protein BV22DRAFT_1044347 [Leucogyrophana mollusca]|uniref:Uncharacterized protein n=1 Tax=Leucogyrophana mollusca TaxID=85980 RepID=A0ACB8BVG1_9AGAM|nr:hypothetical protein BV22DRAFT_1044347 [Leucogyrophana mollusca]
MTCGTHLQGAGRDEERRDSVTRQLHVTLLLLPQWGRWSDKSAARWQIVTPSPEVPKATCRDIISGRGQQMEKSGARGSGDGRDLGDEHNHLETNVQSRKRAAQGGGRMGPGVKELVSSLACHRVSEARVERVASVPGSIRFQKDPVPDER